MKSTEAISCNLIERPIYGSSRVVFNTRQAVADITSASDYYPFGSPLDGRTFSSDKYRFGFNGKENDNEVKGEGNSLDFGGRIYDSRLGRWLSLDPLIAKYPTLTPYNYCGNNPVVLVDFDGKDFGVRINENEKTIIIVANVYTSSPQAYRQAMAGAKEWKDKKGVVEGYTVSFQINVVPPPPLPTDDEIMKAFPSDNFYRKKFCSKKLVLNKSMLNETRSGMYKSNVGDKAQNDPIGNAYFGTDGYNSTNYAESYLTFDGGQAQSGKYVDMNTHDRFGNLGDNARLVAHEFGHLFGLNDKGGAFFSKGGIMEYNGFNPKSISSSDLKNIVKYVVKAIKEGNVEGKAQVKKG